MGQDTEGTESLVNAAEWERRVMRLWWVAGVAVVPLGVAAVVYLYYWAWAIAGVYLAAAVCFLLVFRVLLNMLVQLLVLVEAHQYLAERLIELREAMRRED